VAEVGKSGELDGDDSSDHDECGASSIKTFKKKLPNDYQFLGYLSKGGTYYDGLMREVPNHVFRKTFVKNDF
jgi:hypothetical protein